MSPEMGALAWGVKHMAWVSNQPTSKCSFQMLGSLSSTVLKVRCCKLCAQQASQAFSTRDWALPEHVTMLRTLLPVQTAKVCLGPFRTVKNCPGPKLTASTSKNPIFHWIAFLTLWDRCAMHSGCFLATPGLSPLTCSSLLHPDFDTPQSSMWPSSELSIGTWGALLYTSGTQIKTTTASSSDQSGASSSSG